MSREAGPLERAVSMRMHKFVAAAVAAMLSVGSISAAQTPRTGRLVVTVYDQTRAVIPRATVTITGQDEANSAAGPRVVKTSGEGVATIDGLVSGRYTIQVEFSGFETALVRDVRVRSGETRRSITLQIAKIDQSLTVARDKQTTALDPLGAAFSTVLTREQIAALPDDPDEMEAALKAMAPPGATIRVDGFTGGKLPPKSQIRSIRLPRMDTMAAQNHGGLSGAMFIDIMTQPGIGPMRGGVDFAFRDDALNARNPFVPVKGDEGLQRYGASFSGTIKPNRSSFSVNVQRTSQYDTGNLLAVLPETTLAQPVRRPTQGSGVYLRFDQALNKDHALRFGFQRNATTRSNLGVGGFDLPERAYSTDAWDDTLRISENGPLGRRFFTESRLQVRWSGSSSNSLTEAPAIRVLDAFTSGGAQQSGGMSAVELEMATDLDYVRGRHSMRTGVLIESGSYRADQSSNYLGTFTFSSLADFEAGTPASYTRRIGDPAVRYSNLQAGVYLQDDFRAARSVMLSYGLRYEAQGLSSDWNNFSPRASITWSPFKSGRTTVRGGWGWFSDWLSTSIYQQARQVDGFRQQEINVFDPSYPDPGSAGVTMPTNRYMLAGGLGLPQSMAFNAGIDQQMAGGLRLTFTYTYRHGLDLYRGHNLNTPVNGIRPDPEFANLVEVVSDASSRSQGINVGATLVKVDWHRLILAGNYNYTRAESNTSGAFALPASGDALDQEWGPVSPRHRLSGQFNMQVWGSLGVSLSARFQSGSPYNITTGQDNNEDGVFNDRPAGVGRNSAWTTAQFDMGARLSYSIGFGERSQAGGGGGGTQVMVQIGGPGGGGGMPMGGVTVSGADTKRFHLQFYASAQNVTNHNNYVGYSGVLTSPFFGLPTSVMNPRKLEVGTRFSF
jgi:hypothetical protein